MDEEKETKKWTIMMLETARKLEKEGHEFYLKATGRTKDKSGKEMFMFLAGEEVRHYNVVNSIIKKLGGYPLSMKEETAGNTDVFKETDGGRINKKSDALDALNIGIRAEKKSIESYSSMHDKVMDWEFKQALKNLVDEEKKHLSILEKEVEFVTETGEFHDFKTVGS